MADKQRIKGGEFLIRETKAQDIFTAEDFSEEHKMMAQATRDFIEQEVAPKLDAIDKQEEGLMLSLAKKAGELGLFSVSIPEEFGGLGKDITTSMFVTENISRGASFAVTYGAHSGIGTLPILYFGNEEQKKKYLPKLATGEWISCYCLTEPQAGSDALNAKTKAVKSPDGKFWILNGQKMFITNSGFADVFIVFAKIDGEHFSAFIVEKNFGGIHLGAEEKKMGIKGSSTRAVTFEDCKVPVENLLGEIGRGHKIAFNILNVGRFRLGAGTIGASKLVIDEAVKYAMGRKQFGKSISEFGAIQHKIAEMAVRTYAGESMVYRTAGHLDDAVAGLKATSKENAEKILKGIEEFAVECSILKVAGSEILDYVVDEGVQIFGGYGFSAEFPMDRPYRDSRINRIFEGTNEINRMLMLDMLLKRAMKGELDLMTPAMKIQSELMSVPEAEDETGELFEKEKRALRNAKKALLLAAGFSAQKLMQRLETEQELLLNLADMIIDIYTLESLILRTEKRISVPNSEFRIPNYLSDAVSVFCNDAMDRIFVNGKNAIASVAEGDELRMLLSGLKRFTKWLPVNTKEARRRIARKQIEVGKYSM